MSLNNCLYQWCILKLILCLPEVKMYFQNLTYVQTMYWKTVINNLLITYTFLRLDVNTFWFLQSLNT